ncbi:type II secretion system protein [Burkholderia sp. 22PA0099]|uniref:type II secretion system protein n=1 Tax=Burkholderia sp. 22PA0099 TaxID=3237372 RepID=UPI0039C340D8
MKHSRERPTRAQALRREAGFTYLWVMLLVFVMGLGLLTASTLYGMSLKRDKERELLFIGHQFRDAIRRYVVAHGQAYPDSLDSLVRDPMFPGIRRFLRKVYVDPMTGKAEWGLVKVGGKIVGVYSLSHAAPFKVDNFDLIDAGLKDRTEYRQWVFTYPWNLVIPDDGSPVRGLQTSNIAGAAASAASSASTANNAFGAMPASALSFGLGK